MLSTLEAVNFDLASVTVLTVPSWLKCRISDVPPITKLDSQQMNVVDSADQTQPNP
jgi:hypothetical protein